MRTGAGVLWLQHLLLLLLAVVFASPGMALYDDDGPVVQLTPETFDAVVTEGKLPALVEFYAPWCGHCQALAPQVVKASKNVEGLAVVAAVDCDDDKNKKLCAQAGVASLPTLKLYGPSKQRNPYTGAFQKLPNDYTGARTAKGMVDALLALLTDEHVTQAPDEASLDAFTSRAAASGLPAVVLLTDKGATTPLYKALSTLFRGRAAFAQAGLGARAAAERLGVEAVPGLGVVEPSGERHVYSGKLKPLQLVEWLQQYALPVQPDDGEQGDDAGTAQGGGGYDKEEEAVLEKMAPEWRLQDFEAAVDAPGAWVLAFVQGVDAPDGCVAAARQFRQAVMDTKGVLAFAAVVNVSEAEAAAVQPFVDTGGWGDDPCQLQVALMPDEEDKASEEWTRYDGPLSAKQLQGWALEHIPNLVERLTADAIDRFLMTIQHDAPKVLLFTDKAETPATFRALAYNLRDFPFMFADVHSSERETLERFNVKKVPSMVMMSVAAEVTEGHQQGFRVLPYNLPMKYLYMDMFLRQNAQMMGIVPESLLEGAASGTAVEAARLEGPEDWATHCTGKLGLCVVGALEAGGEAAAGQIAVLHELASRLRSEPLHVSYFHAPSFPSFAATLGLPARGPPSLLVLSPGKLRYRALPGVAWSADALAGAVREVLGGQLSTAPLQQLPELLPEEPLPAEGEAVEEEVVEEEFDLSDIMAEDVEGGATGTMGDRLKRAEEEIKREAEEAARAEQQARAAKSKKKSKKKGKKKGKNGGKDEL